MGYISSVNAIPAMTSNTAPSGVASASSIYGTTYDAWKAFDKSTDSNSRWLTASGLSSGWIQYKFESAIKIGKYVIMAHVQVNEVPKDWTFEGSNDGANWTVLDARTGQTSWLSGEKREYTFNNSNKYSYYRLNISAKNGTTGYLGLAELEMYEYMNEHKILISLNEEDKVSITPSSYNSLIPTMTSNTVPSGVASASSINSNSYDAWKAFDKADTLYGWLTSVNTVVGWLAFEFPEGQVVSKYSIKSNAQTSQNRMPKNWTFEGSNDGFITFDVLDTRSNETLWSDNQVREYQFTNSTKYKKYRINITSNNGATDYTSIGELGMYSHIPSKIKTLSQSSEQDFLKHGMDKSVVIEDTELSKQSWVQQSPTALGSGKTFSKTIDTTKYKIKNGIVK